MNDDKISISAAQIVAAVRARPSGKGRESAWDKGVDAYAEDLCCELEAPGCKTFEDVAGLRAACLNGAGDWTHYSVSGCGLVYTSDIAERLLPPSRRAHVSDDRALALEADALRSAFERRIRPAFERLLKEAAR